MKRDFDEYAVVVKNLTVSYGRTVAVRDVSFSVRWGKLTGIIGPNGAGKSTIIKAMMGLVRAQRGEVRLLHGDAFSNDTGGCFDYVPQQSSINLDFPVTVRDVVMMGRYRHMRRLQKPAEPDEEAVGQSLKRVGMYEKINRQIGQLSGGERQRVFLARALAQEADLFFLDEPFSDIDYTSERVIIDLLKEMTTRQKTIFVIHHNLDKAEEYFDYVLLVNCEAVDFGSCTDVLTAENLARTYGDSKTFVGQNEVVVAQR